MQIARSFKDGDVQNLQKSLNDFLQKGKAAQDGEVREWGGQKYKKQGGKWLPVTQGREGAQKDPTPNKSSKQDQKSTPSQSQSQGGGSINNHEIAQMTHMKKVMNENPDKAYEIYQSLSPEAQSKVPQDVVNKLVENSHTEKQDAASKVFEERDNKSNSKEESSSTSDLSGVNKISEIYSKIEQQGLTDYEKDVELEKQAKKEGKIVPTSDKSYYVNRLIDGYDNYIDLPIKTSADLEKHSQELKQHVVSAIDLKIKYASKKDSYSDQIFDTQIYNHIDQSQLSKEDKKIVKKESQKLVRSVFRELEKQGKVQKKEFGYRGKSSKSWVIVKPEERKIIKALQILGI